MYQRIAHIALVVKDYDEAIEFYTKKLDFKLIEDTDLGDGKRWVIVAPQGSKECSLVLAKADDEKISTIRGKMNFIDVLLLAGVTKV